MGEFFYFYALDVVVAGVEAEVEDPFAYELGVVDAPVGGVPLVIAGSCVWSCAWGFGGDFVGGELAEAGGGFVFEDEAGGVVLGGCGGPGL